MQELINFIKIFVSVFLIFILFFLNNKFLKNIILVGERPDEAKDNGYYFFRYLRRAHNSKKVFYVIEKQSSDISKLKIHGNYIFRDSIKHYLFFFSAKYIFQAFETGCFPSSKFIWVLYRLNLIKKKIIFLQHGITKERLPQYKYQRFKFHRIVSGANREYNFLISDMGYPKDNVIQSGFPRWDTLRKDDCKDILMMFTWRSWLAKDKKSLSKSLYAKNIKELLLSKNLKNLLKMHDKYIYIYIHDAFNEILNFSDIKLTNERIIFLNTSTDDLKTYLQRCELMVTDYSSASFDFSLLSKPVIYYQFDQKDYYSEHAPKGYFDFNTDGFGPVCLDCKLVIESMSNYLSNKFVEPKYQKRIDNFFMELDQNNSSRILKGLDIK
jgi:CDP-glycerol glycerophosphotransferase (TagB/SpsB family)